MRRTGLQVQGNGGDRAGAKAAAHASRNAAVATRAVAARAFLAWVAALALVGLRLTAQYSVELGAHAPLRVKAGGAPIAVHHRHRHRHPRADLALALVRVTITCAATQIAEQAHAGARPTTSSVHPTRSPKGRAIHANRARTSTVRVECTGQAAAVAATTGTDATPA